MHVHVSFICHYIVLCMHMCILIWVFGGFGVVFVTSGLTRTSGRAAVVFFRDVGALFPTCGLTRTPERVTGGLFS